MLSADLKKEYVAILKEELVPAMGCTEPIALAYAAAEGRKVLGKDPEKIVAKCSGNMIKNVHSVTIPNSGGLVGIEAACIIGAVAGDAEAKMEVLQAVNDAGRKYTKELLGKNICSVEFLDSAFPLHFIIELFAGSDAVSVEVRNAHTNIVSIIKNGKTVFEKPAELARTGHTTDRSSLSVENIKAFADEIEISEIKAIFDKEIACNMAIAEEGMAGKYGLGVGPEILKSCPCSDLTEMKAYAAAASEARMCGCDLPVIINAGSGNQGIASSVPVIVYARKNNISEEKLYRSLAFSSLLAIYQKEFIGKLSAFCGAVTASYASATAITYMAGGTLEQINATINNTLANISGIICDGAKASCAAKIGASLDAAMMSHYLAMAGKEYRAGDGVIKEDANQTIRSVGRVAKDGMRQTDKEIIGVMLEMQ